jgi:exosortase K
MWHPFATSKRWASVGAAVLVYALGLALAYGLKRFYAQAGAEELHFVLVPSCLLASLLGGIELSAEAGAGFISHAHHVVVGPACAGVNFLLVCFLALFFPLAERFARGGGPGSASWRRLAWLLASAAVAYLAALLTNALRIVVAVQLFGLAIYGEHLTPEGLHRLAGIVIYCGALLGLYMGAEALLARAAQSGPRGAIARLARRLVPLGIYLGVTVGIPILTRAYRLDAGRFLAHTGFVVATVLVLGLASWLVGALLVNRS